MSRAAVFMDRDGTLVEEHGYLDRLDLLSVFPWTADAVRLLNRAGFATVGRDESGGGRSRHDRRGLRGGGAS